MDESKLELKVGALLLAATAGAVALLYLMGEINVRSGRTVTVNFSHTGNVVKGAPVKLAGFVVGRVDDVRLLAARRDEAGRPLPVEMALSMNAEAEAALRSDAQVTVSSQGPLGEPYLELWPGLTDKAYDRAVPIRGVDAPRLDVVTNRLAGFLESASRVLEKDPEAITKLVGGAGGLLGTADTMLSENREDVRAIAQELAATAKDLRALAATARVQLEPGGKASALLDDASAAARTARTDLPELSKKASTALGGLAAVAGELDKEDGQHLKAMIARYQAAGEKLDGMAARADRLLAKLEAGEGTLGAFMKDKQAYDDLKSLLSDLRKNPWKLLWKD